MQSFCVCVLVCVCVCVYTQAEEETECVWQSALSALLHTCTSGGHWVMRYVELLPLTGLSALLNACVAFRW